MCAFTRTVGSNPTLSALKITHPEGWQSLVECTGLENQQGLIPFGGSNPSPSAQYSKVLYIIQKREKMNTENPLLKPNEQPFDTVPFEDIKTSDFLPAINFSLKEAVQNIEKITGNSNPADFSNTILALEMSSEKLDKVSTVYFHLFGSESDKDFQDLASQISQILANYNNDIMLDKRLFNRVKSVFDQMSPSMKKQDKKLTEVWYKEFIRNGATLGDDEKDKLRKLDAELSTLSPQFQNNNLNATNSYELWLSEKDLDGLPEIAINAAKVDAIGKGKPDDWLITLQMPSFQPFITFSSNRELRKEIMSAFSRKCNGDDFDNTSIVKKIVKLKHKRARLLGYDNFADYILEKRMAENQNNIMSFLNDLYESCFELAKSDLEQVQKLAFELDGIKNFQKWDFAYYSEKLKKKLYDFDDDALRPYFKSDNVVNGVFEVAKKLYGLNFKPLNNVQTYHEDVNVYEVLSENGEHVGILYEDLFPRETKRSGAWMNELRSQGMHNGKIERPHVTFTCNLTKPTEAQPSLLTYREVETIFHEFGHCLHGLLSNCDYSSIGGTSVFWDFVELPSQIMENWVAEKETLQIFAHHYETDELIPNHLIEKIKSSKNFLSATSYLRQLSLGYLDMAWYGEDKDVGDIEDFENKAIGKTSLLSPIEGGSISCSFSHIFAGGYSAGYYSYKWAEVLEADAFEKFKENGIFNRETAESFKENILSKGNQDHPMTLFKAFRGREPLIAPLLKRDGLK